MAEDTGSVDVQQPAQTTQPLTPVAQPPAPIQLPAEAIPFQPTEPVRNNYIGILDPALKNKLMDSDSDYLSKKQDDLTNALKAYKDAQGGNLVAPQTDQGSISTYKEPSILEKTLFTLKSGLTGVTHTGGELKKGIQQISEDMQSGFLHMGEAMRGDSPEQRAANQQALTNTQQINSGTPNDAYQEALPGGLSNPFNLNKEYVENWDPSHPVASMAMGAGKFASSVIAAGGTGGATFALQGIGSAANTVEKMKEKGVKFENGSDKLFIYGSGLINFGLAKGLGHVLLGDAEKKLTDDVISSLSADVTKELADKGGAVSAEEIGQAYFTKGVEFGQRVQQWGLGAIKKYPIIGSELAAANVAQIGLKAGVNALNDNKPFTQGASVADIPGAIIEPFYNNETPAKGDLGQFALNLINTPAATFSALHGLNTAGILTNGSPYKNVVVESLQHDNSPGNVEQIKAQLKDIGEKKGWTEDEINNTQSTVDALADVAGKIPKDIAPGKFHQAIDIIMKRRTLEAVLKEANAKTPELDPAFTDQVEPFKELLTAKIEKENDNLAELIKEKKFTYSFKEGKYYKTMAGGEPEEITKARYDLEKIKSETPQEPVETKNLAEPEAPARSEPEKPTQPSPKKPAVDTEALDELDNELEGLKQEEAPAAETDVNTPSDLKKAETPENTPPPIEKKITPVSKESLPSEVYKHDEHDKVVLGAIDKVSKDRNLSEGVKGALMDHFGYDKNGRYYTSLPFVRMTRTTTPERLKNFIISAGSSILKQKFGEHSNEYSHAIDDLHKHVSEYIQLMLDAHEKGIQVEGIQDKNISNAIQTVFDVLDKINLHDKSENEKPTNVPTEQGGVEPKPEAPAEADKQGSEVQSNDEAQKPVVKPALRPAAEGHGLEVSDNDLLNAIGSLKAKDAKQKIAEASRNKKLSEENYDEKGIKLWDAVHKKLSEDHKEVDETVAAKAKELKNKVTATNKRLREQKADMLDQMNEVNDALWGETENRDSRAEKLMDGTDYYPNGWKNRVEDAGYEVTDKDQIIFQVKDDGIFKIHIDNISDGINEVKKQFPEKVSNASASKSISTPKRSTEKQLAENRPDLQATEVRLQNAQDNLSEAKRLGDDKMEKVWQDEVDREQRVYDIAKNITYPEKQKYYIAKGSPEKPEYEQVDGVPVPNNYGMDAFIHQRGENDFVVSEGSTGLRLSDGTTEEEALSNFDKSIKEKTPESLNKILNEKYEKGLQSPRGKVKTNPSVETIITEATAAIREAQAVRGGGDETASAVEHIDQAIDGIDKKLDEFYEEQEEPAPEPEQASDGKERTSKKERTEKAKKKLDDAIKDFVNFGRKHANALLNPEHLAKGIKMIKAFAEYKILRFSDIAERLADEIGNELGDMWNELKAAYLSYAAEATEEELGAMDDFRTVRKSNITDFLPEYKGSKKTTEPKPPVEHPFPEEQVLKDAEILQGRVKLREGLSPDEIAFSQIDLSLLSTPELHKYVELAARLSVDPNNVLTSEINDFYSSVSDRMAGNETQPPIQPPGAGGPPPQAGTTTGGDDEPIEPRKSIPKKEKIPMDELPEIPEEEINQPAGLRKNYTLWGNLKDIHVRNLEQLKAYSNDISDMAALRSAIQLATSKSQSAVDIKLANDKITKLIGDEGYKVLREALIESRLRGTRQRWMDWSRQVKNSSDNEIDDLFEGGIKSPMYNILSDLQGYEDDENPAMTILSHIDNGNYDDAREYMGDMFENAGDNVSFYNKLSNGKTFDEMAGRDADGNFTFKDPKFKQALELYKKHIEQPFKESHESNDGVFSDALGPLNTYYPLTPVGSSAHKIYQPSKSKYNAPENINNHFTTGSADQYSEAITALSRKLSTAIKTNNKAAFINSLHEAGLIAKVNADNTGASYIVINGKPYAATKVPVADAKTIIAGGQVVHTPVRYVLIPNWLYKEIKPIIEGEGDINGGDHYTAIGYILNSTVNLMLGGPAEAIGHSYRLLSAITNSMPFMQEWAYKNGVLGQAGGLLLNNLFVKKFIGMGKILFTNAQSDEFASDVQEMAKLGLIPEKTWTHTWSKQFAEAMGIEQSQFPLPYKDILSGEWKKAFTHGRFLDFSPMLYGKNGFDLKSRVTMYRLVKAMNPEATPEQHVKMQADLGQYTSSLQGRFEKFIKKNGLGPFATFARAYYRTGLKAVTGTTPLPLDAPNFKSFFSGNSEGANTRKFMYYKLAQLISGGIIGYVGWWALMHHAVTDKWPWEDNHSKLGKIPLTNAMKKTEFAKKYLLNKRTGEYDDIDMSFFNIPINRGLKATGIDKAYQVNQLGGTPGQIAEAMEIQAINTYINQYTSSAAISIPFTTVTGAAPYITSLHGFTGKDEPGFLRKAKTAHAGLQIPSNFAAGMMGINPLFEQLNPASGTVIDDYSADDYESGKFMKSMINIGIPGLISPHGNDKKAREYLKKNEKAIETTIKKESGQKRPLKK